MAKIRKYKRPPQGTSQVHKGKVVTKSEHKRALIANEILYDLEDEDIWAYREALTYNHTVTIEELEKKLQEKYGFNNFLLIDQIVRWS